MELFTVSIRSEGNGEGVLGVDFSEGVGSLLTVEELEGLLGAEMLEALSPIALKLVKMLGEKLKKAKEEDFDNCCFNCECDCDMDDCCGECCPSCEECEGCDD